MQKYFRTSGYIALILLALGAVWFYHAGIEPVDKSAEIHHAARRTQPSNNIPAPEPGTDMKSAPTTLDQTGKKPLLQKRPIDKSTAEKKEYPQYIEDIKEQVYERQIESVDQIPLLDEIVQTGDKDVRQFWGDGWSSVDDWKKEENGFTLEKQADGSLVFNPGPATARQYTFFETPKSYQYDAEHNEFVNEVDYYGKTIYNVVKFINDDVLAMMTISGEKVSLNLYQKDAGQLAAPQTDRRRPSASGKAGLTR